MLSTGSRAPAIALATVDGQSKELDGHWTLAIFFKTTCPTCVYAWPFYERLYRAYGKDGLEVWGISQHDPARTRDYAQTTGSTFPLLIDDGFSVSRRYDPQFVPTAFLINPERKIVASVVSWNRSAFEDLGKQVASSLGVSARRLIRADEPVMAYKPG